MSKISNGSLGNVLGVNKKIFIIIFLRFLKFYIIYNYLLHNDTSKNLLTNVNCFSKIYVLINKQLRKPSRPMRVTHFKICPGVLLDIYALRFTDIILVNWFATIV